MTMMPLQWLLDDDGLVPNNARLPLLVYKGAVAGKSENATLRLFAANGWGGGWINGIYPFHHYHANAHEVLGIVSGQASVQFGGPAGPVVEVAAGDVVVIPAGVGHCRTSGGVGLSVVGAYPAGQEDVDLRRATPADRAAALPLLANVALPTHDPVHGSSGALQKLWAAANGD